MTQNNADALRTLLKQARMVLSVADHQRGSQLIRERLDDWLASACRTKTSAGTQPLQVIAGYWPLSGEPDILPLLTHWHAQGRSIVLPVMQPDHSLHFLPWHPAAPMNTRRFGVQEPCDGYDTRPDVILAPTLGFTPRGERIGYGKGFYDRTLARLRLSHPHPITIGVAWDEADIHRMAPAYEAAAHDQPLDAIVTPSAWIPCAPSLDR